MVQSYNHIRLSLSAANCKNIKSVICNRTIAKCFSLFEKHFFDFTLMFCGTTLVFNTLFQMFDPSFKQMIQTCTFTVLLLFLPKLSRKLFCCRNPKTRHGFFCKSSLLLFIIFYFTLKLHLYLASHEEICRKFHIMATFMF